MSPVELKGGHAPATKVAGGMRVPRKARSGSENETHSPSESSDSGRASEELKMAENVLNGTGLAAQTNQAYPAEAVRKAHTKPVPTHPNKMVYSNCPSHLQQNMNVFQPQRQN